jgi:hypothetical protein
MIPFAQSILRVLRHNIGHILNIPYEVRTTIRAFETMYEELGSAALSLDVVYTKACLTPLPAEGRMERDEEGDNTEEE